MEKNFGPFMQKLIAMRISVLAIPAGTNRPFLAAMGLLSDTEKMKEVRKEAIEWAEKALETLKNAIDNPFSGSDDEEIAEALVELAEEKNNLRDTFKMSDSLEFETVKREEK